MPNISLLNSQQKLLDDNVDEENKQFSNNKCSGVDFKSVTYEKRVKHWLIIIPQKRLNFF